jgi:hypothetical protein
MFGHPANGASHRQFSHQRARRYTGRRHFVDFHAKFNGSACARANRFSHFYRLAQQLGRSGGCRHRRRDGFADPSRTSLSLFHHQTLRQGHRPRAGNRVRDCSTILSPSGPHSRRKAYSGHRQAKPERRPRFCLWTTRRPCGMLSLKSCATPVTASWKLLLRGTRCNRAFAFSSCRLCGRPSGNATAPGRGVLAQTVFICGATGVSALVAIRRLNQDERKERALH